MYFFIGIKGTGMAALASILHDLGNRVEGSDIPKHFFPENSLIERNIPIYDFNKSNIKDGMTVIIGNAFGDDHEEVKEALSNPNVECYRYHVFLGRFIEDYNSICIAGSHGKTTTTGMMSSMLSSSKRTSYLIGDGTGKAEKDSEYFVLEACEFRRHFLAYRPNYAVITNVEIDHVDYFKDDADYASAYEEFAKQVVKKIIVFGDDPKARALKLPSNVIWYGVEEGNDVQAVNIVETSYDMTFDVIYKGDIIGNFNLPFVGRHLLWNALAVITLGILEDIPIEKIEVGLASFPGVKRRFVVEEHGPNIYIDDYAHHPTEVSVTLDSVRKRYPDKKIVAIFKPHRASRVKYFVEEFVQALRKADVAGVCDFTSIDDFGDGVDIKITYLTDRVESCYVFTETEEEAKLLASFEPCVYVFMSSKDIYPFMEMVKRYQNY